MGLDRRLHEALRSMNEPTLDAVARATGVRYVRAVFLPTFHRDAMIVIESAETVGRIECVVAGPRPHRSEEILAADDLAVVWPAVDAVTNSAVTEDAHWARDGMTVRLDIDDGSDRQSVTAGPNVGSGPIGLLIAELIALAKRNFPDDEVEQALGDIERYLQES